ncbi:MAG: hypothetical protein LBK01_02935 [Burkholderiaceae bacterium]|nr:hypothetical protein [Burkholderiaceae bacterium]
MFPSYDWRAVARRMFNGRFHHLFGTKPDGVRGLLVPVQWEYELFGKKKTVRVLRQYISH